MCIAAPMKVLEIDKETNTGKVLFSGNEMTVNLSLVSAETGDYVLVHAGCALEILKEDTALEILAIYKELEEITS